MWYFISAMYEFLLNCFIEFVFYILVDVVTKSSLTEARDESEKRQIWLYESLVLLFASVIIYLFHHNPYILAVLALSTLVYTQLLGRVNFRFWWLQCKTRWDEFQQHEESMEHYHELQSRKATAVSNAVPAQTNWMPPTVTVGASGFTFDPNSVEPWYPSDNGNAAGSAGGNQQGMSNMMPPNVTPTSYLRQRFASTPDFQTPQPIYSSSPIMSQRPVMPRTTDFTRKPLHSYMPSPINCERLSIKNQGFQSVLKNKVMSVLGINPSEPRPPGLPNDGQNICFMNSVLQCLSQTPRLGICLNRDANNLKCSAGEAALVLATAELMGNITKIADVNSPKVLNHTTLRETASLLRGSVVVDPKLGNQRQQDSAEFLMWFLDCLHNALNSFAPLIAGNNKAEIQNNYQNVALQMLKFVYGDLTPQRVIELKKVCRKEIETANSLESDTYAEPIQRLSDLEWLTYKEKNNSVIDDLFTGQLVEAQRCVACNRISVSIQPFSILPVPIVEPRQLNGLVYLEDCFTKFGTTEDLFGPDGLRCECCNLNMNNNSTPTVGQVINGPFSPISKANEIIASASPVLSNGGVDNKDLINLHKRRLLLADAGLTSSTLSTNIPQTTAAMSPIPSTGEGLNDSGFHDNQVRTSTPIHSTALAVKLTDGQRRSLLRQLPECLIVQLMRFSHHFGELRKLRKPVSVPLTGLDLTNLIIDNVMHREDMTAMHASFRYDLYGVCVHLGGDSMSAGHYISFAKLQNGQWYKFDDESAVAVNMEYELTTKLIRENAYMLFYRKSGN